MEDEVRSLPDIVGADAIVDWFGAWPRFHDHELLCAPMAPAAEGAIRIRSWVTNWKQVTPAGRFLRERECLVSFELESICEVRLTEPTFPAIIFDFDVIREGAVWKLQWDASYGAEGVVVAERVRVCLDTKDKSR